MEGKFVSYLRVSTEEESRSGLGLAAQRKAVDGYLNGGGRKLLGEHVEQESGSNGDRPGLHAALRQCRLTGAKLVIARLDRLSRNVAFIAALMDSGCDFVAVDFPEANRLTVHILAAMAEHERGLIRARTSAALKAARERGIVLGIKTHKNPEKTRAALRAAQPAGSTKGRATRTARANSTASDVMAYILDIQGSGVTAMEAIARELTARHIETPSKRGEWRGTMVSRIIARASA